MRRWKLFVLICSLGYVQGHAQQDPQDALEACRPRMGLPHFFAKLEKGGPVTIAYLGGSITAASGGWRDQSADWFQKVFTKAQIHQINAGVGGTGSSLGVFRLQKDVLTFKPDLVFVEFAVNDGGPYIHQTMEGIVRKIWKDNLATDICFVYTLAESMLPTLNQGHLVPSMLAMEHIAQHYGIPSVQMGLKVLSLLKDHQIIFQGKQGEAVPAFSGDGVHPHTQTGHRIYTEALIQAMQQIKGITQLPARNLKKPYTTDNWEDAVMVSADQLLQTGKWTNITQTTDSLGAAWKQRFPHLLRADSAGAEIRVSFKGRLAGLYDLVGPGCGQYAINIDNDTSFLMPRFDRHATYYRSHYFLLPELPSGSHQITFKVSEQLLDKQRILGAKAPRKPGLEANFKQHACFAGYLLLLGTLSK
ncbi:SGNH/GDSL hydrolase family protein [Niabella sp. CC-SYL272]|uniref:SGNH/GDSL hydrolase family protein n=1 Tax=Niabella agricola TaxID=2891571 RepID=UPI001F3A739D|nr:SGNH/GDSL hydrolase family protein [Niabella agricola]MCF3111257.1 SGNH/GDSL hydrolase family protein [Niabella agricola]